MASRSWNRVELIGNLTRDPELRYTPNGAAVATFGLATNRTYVTEGEKKEEVDFHRLVAWNKLAELCNQLLKKGNKVFISGRLQTRTWEQDGQQKNITEIVIEDMILLTPKSSGEYQQAVSPKGYQQAVSPKGYGVVASEDLSTVPPVLEEELAAKSEVASKEEKVIEAKKEGKNSLAPKESISDDDLPF